MDLKDFPYRAIFASAITPLVSEEKDKYLALASSEEIRKLIPDLPTQDIDLLPWAAQGFNINRANKNDDGINTEIALTMYKGFINRYLDIEHKRSNIIGTILTANLAEFGTNKPLTEEDIEKFQQDKPFNVVLGGVIWKIVNPKLADLIEESNDKDSDKYMAFSISWELGFKEFDIAILKDESPNLDGAEIITGEKVDKLKKYLKAFGGSGVMNGKRLIRMPTGKIVSLGAAITEKPAAFVKGIITASELDSKNEFTENLEHLPPTWDDYNKDFDSIDPKDHNCDIGDEIKSQSEADIKAKVKEIVNAYKELKSGNINKDEFTEKTGIELTFAMKLAKNFFLKQKDKNKTTQLSKSSVTKREDIMKLNSIEDITDENLREMKASVISDFIKSELTKASEKWDTEKKQKENQLSEAKQSIEKTAQALVDVKASLDLLNKERKDRVELDNFNSRMSEIDASYNLDDETRSALVDDIKAIASDEDYEKYKIKIGKILKAYKKSKSQKDSDEQKALYREDNMNAKKKDVKKESKADMDEGMGKKSKASEDHNQIGKDNKSPGQDGNDDVGDEGIKDDDHQFVDRDGKNHNPTDGENNGEHPNHIGKDNWNKPVNGGKVSGKNDENDGGHNAGASIIEDALENAEKVGQNIPNTSSSKPQTMKEKYAQMFASSIEVNGKKLVL